MIHAAPVKHSGERREEKKKLAKDGGGGVAVGNLLNKALLLGNSSNSTKQWGRGVLHTASGLLHLSHIITRKSEGPETQAIKGGQLSGAFQDDTEKNARAGR